MTIAIGDSGSWTVTAPFVLSDAKYTCSGVTSIDSLENLGVSVLASIYGEAGLGQDVYKADKLAGVKIITLKMSTGVIKNIPESYISASPDFTEVPYSNRLIGINLGALPDNLDLAVLKTALKELADANLGVTTSILERNVSISYVVSDDKHAELEAQRLSNIDTKPTTTNQLKGANKLIAEQATKISYLEQIISERFAG